VGKGLATPEYEYRIPAEDAESMLDQLCEKPLIEKIRYKIPHKGLIWEVDEFRGENHGLILAEVELASIEQSFEKPEWIGKEVTGMPQYFNSQLVINPFTKW
jgi:CYTH domain-containing protein